MKVRLISDFIDWYDHAFDGSVGEFIYRRMSKAASGKGKDWQLCWLSDSFRVPFHGCVGHMTTIYKDFQQFVVYTDVLAHCGEGKVLLPLCEAANLYPHDTFCSEYIPSLANGKSFSYRLLFAARKRFWIKYTSSNDWRSNCGDCKWELLEENESLIMDNYLPNKMPDCGVLAAIDFVLCDGKLWAIDFNTAPGLVPIKGIVSAEEIVAPIREWYRFMGDDIDA